MTLLALGRYLSVILFLFFFISCKPKIESVYKNNYDEFFKSINSQKSDFEKTKLIRNHVAGSFAVSSPDNDAYTIDFLERSNFKDYFIALNEIKDETKATSCGPLSRAYVNVLATLGFRAYTYNFGILNTNQTHELVLVEIIDSKGQLKLIVQDPTYCLTILDAANKPADFRTFLYDLKTRNTDHYHLVSDSIPTTIYLPKWLDPTDSCEQLRTKEMIKLGYQNPISVDFILGFRNFWYLNSDPCGYFFDFSIINGDRKQKEQAFFRLMGNRISEMNGNGADVIQNQLDSILLVKFSQ